MCAPTVSMYSSQHLCAKSWRHCLRARRDEPFLMKVTKNVWFGCYFRRFVLLLASGWKRWCNERWSRVNRYHLPLWVCTLIRWCFTGANIPTAVIASMSSDISQSQLSIAQRIVHLVWQTRLNRDANVTQPAASHQRMMQISRRSCLSLIKRFIDWLELIRDRLRFPLWSPAHAPSADNIDFYRSHANFRRVTRRDTNRMG